MTTFIVEVERSAQKQLNRLPRQTQAAIYEMLTHLERDPRPSGTKKMAGRSNRYRLRHGDYRIVYDVFEDTRAVAVVAIGHRSVVYRHLSLLLILLRMRS